MNLKSQVISLELSKILKDLGVKQESLWYWIKLKSNEKILNYECFYIYHDKKDPLEPTLDSFSAFTSSELLELLPRIINKPESYFIEIVKTVDNDFFVVYKSYLDKTLIGKIDKNLSEACAKMLIYLIENGFLDINHVIPPNAFDLIMKDNK